VRIRKESALKTTLIIICLFSIIAVSTPAFLKAQNSADELQTPEVAAITPATRSEILTSIIAIPSATPRGPDDRLRDYERGMATIAQQFSAQLRTIVQSVQSGQLSREQGEQLTGEQYQIARMQFELFSALHRMLQQDLARATVVRYEPAPSEEREIVMVALPFSSLELSPSLAEYLELSPEQVNAIQQLMSDERHNLEPLMAQMRATKTKLLAATAGRQTNEKEIKALADAQAAMLTKLILANSRMQGRIYKLLSRGQQKKLDAFKESSEP
jgi:LTXXQ motif family protein